MNRMVNKKKKKKFHPLKKLFNLAILAVIVYLAYKYITFENVEFIMQKFTNINASYGFTEETLADNNDNISNLSEESEVPGQVKFENMDGYTTKFTTLNEIDKKTYIEYKQNQNSSWSEKSYWGGTMSENGCGITSIAIIASGYGLKTTPETLRKKYYPHLEGAEIKNALERLGVKCTDFYYNSNYISKKYIKDWLKTNRPVLICVDSTKKNKWTEASHYMVLLECNDDGLVYLSNPNGIDGEANASGWYNISEIFPYIVKALFIESY